MKHKTPIDLAIIDLIQQEAARQEVNFWKATDEGKPAEETAKFLYARRVLVALDKKVMELRRKA